MDENYSNNAVSLIKCTNSTTELNILGKLGGAFLGDILHICHKNWAVKFMKVLWLKLIHLLSNYLLHLR